MKHSWFVCLVGFLGLCVIAAGTGSSGEIIKIPRKSVAKATLEPLVVDFLRTIDDGYVYFSYREKVPGTYTELEALEVTAAGMDQWFKKRTWNISSVLSVQPITPTGKTHPIAFIVHFKQRRGSD